MDCETERLNVSITKNTYDELVMLTKKRNMNLNNHVNLLLNEALSKYRALKGE